MEIDPQEVIKHLSSEISRLNIELAILRAALSKKESDGGEEETRTR
jgi:hypothetical protein